MISLKIGGIIVAAFVAGAFAPDHLCCPTLVQVDKHSSHCSRTSHHQLNNHGIHPMVSMSEKPPDPEPPIDKPDSTDPVKVAG